MAPGYFTDRVALNNRVHVCRTCNHGRRSVGDGRGDTSPHFSAWGDSIGIVPPPTFQLRKIARHIA